MRRLVVGISGASGATYGIHFLRRLRELGDVETHLVLSEAAKRTIGHETAFRVGEVEALATRVYPDHDIGAAIASGSFRTAGMVIIPCSIETAASVVYSAADTLISRAAGVTLKEGRPLILVVSGTPLHRGRLVILGAAVAIGATLIPATPDLDHAPVSLDDVVQRTVERVLGRLDLGHDHPGA